METLFIVKKIERQFKIQGKYGHIEKVGLW